MPPRALASAARRHADRTSDRIAAIPASRMVVASVAAVTAGAAGDGNALVTVTYDGATVTAAGYAASYTPVVGHRVLCAIPDRQVIVVCRVIGYP